MSITRRLLPIVLILLAACRESFVSTMSWNGTPLRVKQAPEVVFDQCLEEAISSGWEIQHTDRSSALIVASTRGVLGTKDDTITIHIVDQYGDHSRVDVTWSCGGPCNFPKKKEHDILLFLLSIARKNGLTYSREAGAEQLRAVESPPVTNS